MKKIVILALSLMPLSSWGLQTSTQELSDTSKKLVSALEYSLKLRERIVRLEIKKNDLNDALRFNVIQEINQINTGLNRTAKLRFEMEAREQSLNKERFNELYRTLSNSLEVINSQITDLESRIRCLKARL